MALNIIQYIFHHFTAILTQHMHHLIMVTEMMLCCCDYYYTKYSSSQRFNINYLPFFADLLLFPLPNLVEFLAKWHPQTKKVLWCDLVLAGLGFDTEIRDTLGIPTMQISDCTTEKCQN